MKPHTTALPLILAAALSAVACAPAAPLRDRGGRFPVIAYYAGRGAGIDQVPAGKLTHIIYSFLHLKGNRLALDGPGDSIAIGRLIALKSRNPRLNVMLSVGGWGGCAPCSHVFATPGGRKEFARSARDLLDRFHADGIDVDWEYPAIEGYPGHISTPEDRHNFTLLMRDLRGALGDSFELSFASGGFTECLLRSFEWEDVMPLVNRVNVMTYDLVNATSIVTGHHTPLFSVPGERESTDHAVRLLDSLGIEPGKIVIGAAFYARVWEGVPDTNNGLFQPGKFVQYIPYRNLDAYFRQKGNFKPFWDSTAEAPFSFSAKARQFATYDNGQSVRLKTAYAMKKHLGGIMFWELEGDLPDGGLLEAIDGVCGTHR